MIIAISASPNLDISDELAVLAKRHGLTAQPDPTRALCDAYGFQTLYDLPGELQRRVREELLHGHAAELAGGKDALLGFSVFPWLADWMRWYWHSTPTEAWDALMAVGAAAAQRYDRIYHVANGKQRGYDGFAWLDRRNGKQIDGLLRHLYGELGVTQKVQYTLD